MPITRYYVCGEMSTVHEMAEQNGIEETIAVVEFPNNDALHWFEQGLEFADGWLKIASHETREEAVAYIEECMK